MITKNIAAMFATIIASQIVINNAARKKTEKDKKFG